MGKSQSYDVIKAIIDSLGNIALDTIKVKEASALTREGHRNQRYLKKMDHINAVNRIETTSRLNTLSKEIDNQTIMVVKRLKDLQDWNIPIEDQSKLDELDVSPDFGNLAGKMKEDAGNKLFVSIEDFKEGISEYDKKRYKLQHLAALDKSLKLLQVRGSGVIAKSQEVERDAGKDLYDSVLDHSDFLKTAEEEGYDLGSFDWNVFMSKAPTGRDTYTEVMTLKALDSMKGDINTSELKDEFYKKVAGDVRSYIKGYNIIGTAGFTEEEKQSIPNFNMQGYTWNQGEFGDNDLITLYKATLENVKGFQSYGQLEGYTHKTLYDKLIRSDIPNARRDKSGILESAETKYQPDFSGAPFNKGIDSDSFAKIRRRFAHDLKFLNYLGEMIEEFGLQQHIQQDIPPASYPQMLPQQGGNQYSMPTWQLGSGQNFPNQNMPIDTMWQDLEQYKYPSTDTTTVD